MRPYNRVTKNRGSRALHCEDSGTRLGLDLVGIWVLGMVMEMEVGFGCPSQ